MRFPFLFVLCACSAVASTWYSVEAVGMAGVVGGIALNNSGTVAGYSVDARFGSYAWVQPSAGAPRTLGTSAITGAINDSGTVAGTSWNTGNPAATSWSTTSNTELTSAYGLGINDHGTVTGGGVHGLRGSAFIQDGNQTTWLDLGWWSSAYAINDEGNVAGYYLTGSTARAFVWSSDTGAKTLSVPTGRASYAHALNDVGDVAGTGEFRTGALTAALWTNGSVHNLGTLGGSQSGAYGVSNSGAVVGYSLDAASRRRAFLWQDNAMLDLNGLIDPTSGWMLEEASAINDAGQIAGVGRFNGQAYAFLLTPAEPEEGGVGAEIPEPGTFAVVSGGLVVLARYRRLLQRR